MDTNKPIWQARPSAWMLTRVITLFIFLISLSVIALFSQMNTIISLSFEPLLGLQTILYKHPFICYAIYLTTAFFSLKLLIDFLKLKFESYVITPKKLIYTTGVLNQDINQTLLFRIVDLSVERPILLRLLGRGHLILYSNDPSLESSGIKPSIQTPDGRKGVYLAAIKDPLKVKMLISQHVDKEREKRLMRSTELL